MKKTRAIAIFLTCITAASMGATILTGCSGGKDSSGWKNTGNRRVR